MNTWKYNDQWAAGFFDGEGCVSVSRRKRGNFIEHFMAVQVGQNDRRPLDELCRIFGGSICNSKTQTGCWRWRIHGKEGELFLKRISMFCLVKRDQIEIVLRIRKLIGKPGQRLLPGIWNKREALWHELQRSKGKE